MFNYFFSQLIREIFPLAQGSSAKQDVEPASASNAAIRENFRTYGAPAATSAGVAPQDCIAIYTSLVASWQRSWPKASIVKKS